MTKLFSNSRTFFEKHMWYSVCFWACAYCPWKID